MEPRPFRWLPYNGKRHAVDADAVARDRTATLCGEQLVIPAVRPTKDEWCWPTCRDCDNAWRVAEGIPLIPVQTVRRTSRHDARRTSPRHDG